MWVVNDISCVPPQFREAENIVFISRESDSYLRYIATAKYLINNVTFPSYFIRREGQIYCNTWHGTPLKSLGDANNFGQVAYGNVSRNFLQASWLIQPKDNSYWRRNIEIHGISPEDTQDKPTLADIWEEIKGYIENQTIIAHNTAFDMYAIADALAENGIPLPDLDYFCSLRIAQKAFSLLKYSLSPLCASLGISFAQCHRAGSDS